MTPPTAAIDLGGTHVRAAVIGDDGSVHHRTRHHTPHDDARPDVLARLIAELADESPLGRVVVGVPGVIDHQAEALVKAPNLPPAWTPWLRASWLGDQTGLPVSLANDADLAAVGEATFGAGRDHHDVVYLTISTGVGAGIVVGDKLVRGVYSGGEIGHTVIDLEAARAGRPCTVEELGAGPAIAKAAADAGLVERDDALADLVRTGHPEATAIWNRAMEAVAVGVVNLAWLITPQVVVIGGGVGTNSDLVIPVLTRMLADHGPALHDAVEVVPAALGDDAGLVGAASWFEAVGRADARG